MATIEEAVLPPPPMNAAHVTVRAPANATVWIGGWQTPNTGSVREFDSPPLTPGKQYTYEVRAVNSGGASGWSNEATAATLPDTPAPPSGLAARAASRSQIELAWTVVPVLIVFVLILVTARTIYDVQGAVPPAGALNVTVIGHQWWWEIRYPQLGIVTANELHVPVSEPTKRRPTFLKLESADVAHSFWAPQLAGKTDLIPNRTNRMWIEPKQPGTYLGNCAEYCGTQHARMLLRVIAHPPGEFEQWVAAQRQPPVEDPQARAGREVFFSTSCVNCHTINRTQARGTFGPDLTHLMSRDTLAAGAAPNTPETLRAWVRDPQTLKEGCLMPNMQLADTELDHLVAYLLSLK